MRQIHFDAKASPRNSRLFTQLLPRLVMLHTLFFAFTDIGVPCAGVLYHLVDLGTLPGGKYSGGRAINASGLVVGDGDLRQNGPRRAVFWKSPGDPQDVFGTDSSFINISDDGNAVGNLGVGAYTQAVLWSPATGTHVLGTLPGDLQSSAFGINSSGAVVGFSVATSFSGPQHAFLWTPSGGMTYLHPLPGGTSDSAAAINKFGQIAGGSDHPTGGNAVIWSSDGQITNLGGLQPGYGSNAYDINDAGAVVGHASVPGASNIDGFLWTSADGMRDLGKPTNAAYSEARAINNLGQIVGYCSLNGTFGNFSALLWNSPSDMKTLDSVVDSSGAGWKLEFAYDINDSGQIVGSGKPPGALFDHAYVLTPYNVPEPSSAALSCIGVIIALACIRRPRGGRSPHCPYRSP